MVRKVLLVVLIATFLLPSGSAQASTLGKAKFHGAFNMFSGFSNPIVAPPQTSGFSFVTQTCIGTKSDIAKPKGTGTYGTNCTVVASGTASGYCGLMSGTGSGWIHYYGTAYKSVAITFRFRIDGTKLTITGSTSKGALIGSAQTMPDPFGAGSCSTGTQSRFLALGSMAFSAIHPPPAV